MNEIAEEYKRLYEKDLHQVFTDLEEQDNKALSQLLKESEQFNDE